MKAIILAGGSGSRLWPLSRDQYPKQLLNLEDDLSLLQQTFLRLSGIIDASNITAVTNVRHYYDIKHQLNKIDDNNVVIAEPLGRNTAPAIACALEYFKETSSVDDVVLIVPSDHLIRDTEGFHRTVKEGERLAQAGYIVTFGIRPTYPETGYGYIKTLKPLEVGYKVDKFVEKPDYNTALHYIESGHYYWNGGIFMAKISTLLDEFHTFCPEIFNNLLNLSFSGSTKINYNIYESMPCISIDYAIMEKSDKIALVELKSDWNDLGSWQSLYDVKQKDENGNVITGKVITENVKNSFIYSQKELVAVSDLEDVVIVETEDAIMACRMDKSQNVKKLYDKLKSIHSDTTKLHKTVFRPWGYYTCMNSGKGYLTKTICVLPHQKLSVQSHNHRSEHWVVLEGEAFVLREGQEYTVRPGESIDIPVGAKHSLQNHTNKIVKIIEIQKGDYISEDDIIRYEDSYGRV
jgi:mannose-1-phosphate guanylyltransferase/mannose-6-phosphate isomerase